MKKYIICSILTICMLSICVCAIKSDSEIGPAAHTVVMKESEYNIRYEGDELRFFDNNYKKLSAYEYNGITYIPLRSYSETVGKVVEWDEDSQEIDVLNKQTVYVGKTYGSYVHGGDTLPRVSMIQLIANPEKYNNQLVNVQGFISAEFECDRLFLTRDDMTYLNEPNSLALNIRTRNSLDTPIEELEHISGSFVEMEGTFVNTEYGAYLYDVSYIHCKREYD